MINVHDILETVEMIKEQNLDIRTVTMGISLFDCISDDKDRLKVKIFDKVTRCAKNLVSVCEELERMYGIPIVNKRISVTPLSYVGAGLSPEGFVELAEILEAAAQELGVNFIGGFSAHVQKGEILGAKNLIEAIPEAMARTSRICSSINVATTKAGINMDAVKRMGEIIKETAALTADKDSIGCAKIVVFANIPEDNPFMAGAVHGIGEPDTVINVGVSGPGVVAAAIKEAGECDFSALAETVKRIAFKITRVGQLIAAEASHRLGTPYGIVDLSLAPTPAAGDSVAEILENMGLEMAGAHGTTAALALLNDAVKKGGVMASNHVGGLSGAFIPVSEDRGMIAAATDGVLTLDKLEAMTAVCSVGLDMIAIPGDTPASTISGIIADEISIGVVNNKTTAVRIIPVVGKSVGDSAEFGGLLGYAPIMPVKQKSCKAFINRGGRIPAPIHSLKN